jgi:predicted RND superfamily exporter protein
MVASIVTGTAIDYAIHLRYHSSRQPAEPGAESGMEAATAISGASILLNAIVMALGFGVLAFGSVLPMVKFGALTAGATLLSPALTLVLLPPLFSLADRRARAAAQPKEAS